MFILGADNLVIDTQHPDSLKRIQELESMDKNVRLEVPEPEFGKPNWIKTFENIDNLQEGEIVYLVGYVEPVGDPHLKIEWYLNGVPLKNCKFLKIYLMFHFFMLILMKLKNTKYLSLLVFLNFSAYFMITFFLPFDYLQQIDIAMKMISEISH